MFVFTVCVHEKKLDMISPVVTFFMFSWVSFDLSPLVMYFLSFSHTTMYTMEMILHISLLDLLFYKEHTKIDESYFIFVCPSVINTVCSTIVIVLSDTKDAVCETFWYVLIPAGHSFGPETLKTEPRHPLNESKPLRDENTRHLSMIVCP